MSSLISDSLRGLLITVVISLSVFEPVVTLGADVDQLVTDFHSPPNSARPRVYWHWMNGNVTQQGIKADLEWMQRVGIGGALLFEAGGTLANYQFITPRLIYGDTNWQAAIHLAASTSEQLGLELGTAAAPGWSETGGPWVKPEQAMKKYVWSETVVDGGKRFNGQLPAPPSTTGVFQNSGTDGGLGRPINTGKPEPRFYADALVVAYRIPAAESMAMPAAKLSSSGANVELEKLTDGDYGTSVNITAQSDQMPPWIQAEYAEPVIVRGVLLGQRGLGASDGNNKPQLLISDDGQQWRLGATLTGPATAVAKTYGFAPLRARYFRLLLAPPLSGMPLVGAPVPPLATGLTSVTLSEFSLLSYATVDRFAEKTAFSDPIDYSAAPTVDVHSDEAIHTRDVINLTHKMNAQGQLDWTPPGGQWRIIRLGYSLTGKQNHPAQVEATGLEVDKLSRRHVSDYLDEYLRRLQVATGPDLMGKRGLRMVESDSWEAGVQNWTEDLPAQFKQRRGYDLLPWLPVLTGHVVESASASDKFLWDFRRTLQDLLAQHYQVLSEKLHAQGLSFYSEAQGDTWRAVGDGMEMKRHADVPMAEYWYSTFAAGPGQPTLKTDMKESASVANLYGRQLVANESLTVYARQNPWAFSPAMLKPVVDEIFAYGINQLVLHSSVHQPDDNKKPGLTLGPFGQYFNRHDSWAEQAKPFMDYIARSSYLLQQGKYVADVAYFYGEDQPLVSLFGGKFDETTERYQIEVPDGYGYDFVNAQALREEFTVSNGRLNTRSGMQYRLLYMHPGIKALTLPTLTKLLQLVRGGATLSGAPLNAALGLTASDAQLRAVAAQLWGAAPSDAGMRQVGRGRVYWGKSINEVLAAEQVAPDASFVTSNMNSHVMQLHRRLADTDVYFVSNRRNQAQQVEASFRVMGKVAELWHADTGKVEQVSYRMEGGRTIVPLQLSPYDAVFVLFRAPTAQVAYVAPIQSLSTLTTLDGEWQLEFPAGSAAPAKLQLNALGSWSDYSDASVKYFSGTATYTKSLVVERGWLNAGRVLLDLGAVKEIAEVLINGQSVGIAWKAPYQLDVTDALKAGVNQLQIKVTNLWTNRLIGDAQPGITNKTTWTSLDLPATLQVPALLRNSWTASDPLLPSGLLGPVQLRLEHR